MNSLIKERLEKIEKGIVPEGYKETNVGIIPVDWEVKNLGEISNINQNNINGDDVNSYFYYDLSSINNGIITKAKEKINYTELPSRARRIFRKNNILFSTVRPNLKGFGYIDFEPVDSLCSTGFAVLEMKDEADSRYVYYNLFTNPMENRINSLTVGSNYPALNITEVRSLKIPTPPLQEQEEIAHILSTWDKAIENIEKLIKEKEIQKKGIMQELLTGETRLPGFNEEWKEVRLGEVTECLDSKRKPINQKDRNDMKGEIPYYGANGIVDYVDDYIFNEKLILLAEDGGNFNEFYEKPIAIRIEGKSWVNNHAHVLKPIKSVDFDFIFYSLEHRDIRKYINGTTRLKLNRGEMEIIELLLPSLEEQKAIAEILSTADKEIELLNKLLENKKEEKKGLMQLLLTGIVRV